MLHVVISTFLCSLIYAFSIGIFLPEDKTSSGKHIFWVLMGTVIFLMLLGLMFRNTGYETRESSIGAWSGFLFATVVFSVIGYMSWKRDET
jgi:hypothetical protein